MAGKLSKNSKSILSLIGIGILIMALFAGLKLLQLKQQAKVGAAPSSKMFISPSVITANPGSNIEFWVKVDTSENHISGVDVVVNYDINAMEVTSLQKGVNIADFDNELSSTFDNTNGQLIYTNFTLNRSLAVTGSSIELLKVSAKVKANANLSTFAITIDPTSAASAVSESQNAITSRAGSELTVEAATGGPGEPNSCGGTCGSNYNCKEGFFCYQGFCRVPQCPDKSDCNCAAATARPTEKPAVTAAPTSAGNVNRPTQRPVTVAVTITPRPTASPQVVLDQGTLDLPTVPPLARVDEYQDPQPQNKLAKYFYAAVYFIGGVILIVLVGNAIKYILNRNKRPTIVNPEN